MPEFFNRSRLLLQVGDLSLPVLTQEGPKGFVRALLV